MLRFTSVVLISSALQPLSAMPPVPFPIFCKLHIFYSFLSQCCSEFSLQSWLKVPNKNHQQSECSLEISLENQISPKEIAMVLFLQSSSNNFFFIIYWLCLGYISVWKPVAVAEKMKYINKLKTTWTLLRMRKRWFLNLNRGSFSSI